jgi:hypothetical protein
MFFPATYDLDGSNGLDRATHWRGSKIRYLADGVE